MPQSREWPWDRNPQLARLAKALKADGGDVRIVGGAVRDAIAGFPVADIDLATPLEPDAVIERLEAMGAKAIPTGIAHGTVTAVVDGAAFEITTLRRDVATDGRRATIAFAHDWSEDAARRDFTINALYVDPTSGELFDYHGGAADLAARRVCFIGDAAMRISEDHLRILRYFRFLARYGGEPDVATLATLSAKAGTMRALSKERIADELLKLLAAPDPTNAIAMMVAHDIFAGIVPEIDAASSARLEALIADERACGRAPDAMLRLIAVLPEESDRAVAAAARLKMSNATRKRIKAVRGSKYANAALEPRSLAYRLGTARAIDVLMLGEGPDKCAAIAALEGYRPPTLPVSGGDIVKKGIAPGPEVARLLSEFEDRWIEAGFPDGARSRVLLDQLLNEDCQ